jgi:hypothetical protein
MVAQLMNSLDLRWYLSGQRGWVHHVNLNMAFHIYQN